MSLLEDLFNFISRKRSVAQKEQQSQAIQAFILEPILTPSGLVDDPTHGADAIIIDPHSGIDPSLDFPSDIHPGLDHAPDVDVHLSTETILPENIELFPFIDDSEPTISGVGDLFNSGIFTVGESGKVSIDYLFDGGGYQGQLAIFNLDGMEQYDISTPDGLNAFIHEAASRSLSNSDLGHVVIADATEGAKFSGTMPSEWENHNFGEYQGVKTFDMQAGDRFAVMLVPNGTVQQVLDGNQDADLRPLFSLNTVNPNEAFHAGQIADITGDGNTFVLEDLRVDTGSDHDYNDIIFQVRGATGTAVHLDKVINPDLDWRSTDLGHALLDYAQPYVTPVESVDAHLSLPEVPPSHQPLIGIIDTGVSAHNPDIDYTHTTLGHDYIDGDNNPLLQPGEGNEHGTHIAGIVSATQNNDIGIDGINDQAPLWVGRATGSGHWADSLTEFVDAAKASDQPNAVVNLSFDLTQINPDGSITTRYEFTPHEIQALEYARQNHVLIVAAAGNDGGVMSALGQASQEFDNIITVGSADGLERADYSSYGYGLDIVAHGGTADNPVLSTVGDDLGAMAGTSVATAKVTGAISQVWATNPELSYRQVIELLKLTATDLKDPGWDAETGAGLLNIAAAVSLAKVTEGEDYLTPAIDIPATWSGEGVVTPTERAADGSSNTTSGTATTLGNGVRVRPYAVQPGDTLRTIALRELNNINRWTEIKQADGSNFTSPSTPLQPGAILSLPVNYQTGSGVSVASSPIIPVPWLPPAATARNINPDDGVADNFYHGRKEFDNRIGRNNSNDYYEFDLEQLLNGDTHYLRFALRNQAGTQDISRNNADVELLDQFGTVVSLDSLWQPGVQPAGVQLKGGKYYLRVKNTSSSTILYKLVVHVDSAKEDRANARELETFTGRHQFQDFIGATRGDAADYYRFTVKNQSFLRFSLGDPTGTALKADANIDLLDANGNVIEAGFNPGDNKKYGDSPLAPGTYYMRVTPGNSTANANYLLTMQMAEDLGIYTGRHEYPNRSLGGNYTEAFHQFQIDAPGDLRLALRNLNADANLELYQDNGTGIVNATLINPTSGVDQTGTTNELKEYLNLPAGNYLVKTKLVDSTVARANYDLVMNLDQAKNTLAQARDLGNLTGQRREYLDFLGTNKSDGVDYYKFNISDPRILGVAVRDLSAGVKLELFDQNQNPVALTEIAETGFDKHAVLNGSPELPAGTYYVKVTAPANADNYSNYKLVLNLLDKLPPNPPLNSYYPELGSQNDNWWDRQSGDDTLFDGSQSNGESIGSVKQIYADLSRTIFGRETRMTAGYAYDQSYHNGFGTWHSALDMSATQNDVVKAAVNGKVASIIDGGTNGYYIAVDETDANGQKVGRRWWYVHLASKGNLMVGDTVQAGQTSFGKVRSDKAHLHLAVQTNLNMSASSNVSQNYVINATMSPLEAYWQSRNR